MIDRQRHERDSLLARKTVARELAGSLMAALDSTLIKVITGPRRAGKSTLALQALSGRRFAYLNFEDDGLRGQLDSDALVDRLTKVYENPDYYFFDEIQNFPGWESFANKLHRRGGNLVLTGSNSRLLSSELASALTGRHLAFELLPFGYREFLTASGRVDDSAFPDFLAWGGFPEVVLQTAERASYLRNLFDSVVLRDVVARHRIRRASEVHDLLTLLINNAANRFSARSLERALGTLATTTIQKFIGFVREAYLVHDLQPYFFKPRLRVKADRKIYAYDNGLITAKSQPTTSNTARLLENLVFIELVRRGNVPNANLFYYQTQAGHEVDFLLRQGAVNRALVQVSRDLTALKTREREVRALANAADELGVSDLTIVTLATRETIHVANHRIEVLPCPQWILGTS